MGYSIMVQWLTEQQARDEWAACPAEPKTDEAPSQDRPECPNEAMTTEGYSTPVAIVLDALTAPRPRRAA